MASKQQLERQITSLSQRLNEVLTTISTINRIFREKPYGYTDAGEAVFRYEDREIGRFDLQEDLEFLSNESTQLTSQIADLRNQFTRASASITAEAVALPTQTIIRDYRHAARIFVNDQYRLSPKYGFLFYVEFDFNPLITNISDQTLQYKSTGSGNAPARELGMLVKSATLPKFTIDTKTHNAYNRKNIVQNSIKYDPVQISFHDDQSDNVRNFWYDYYSFFFRDPDYADATYNTPHKYQSRPSFDWGYSPRRQPIGTNLNGHQAYQYIQAIRIYSLYQKNFSEYQLVNPTITAFKHGDHVNGETSLLSHEMTIQYETVKYLTGYTTANNAGGFVDLHYDTVPSPLGTYNGGPKKIPNGQGGYADIPDTITDLAGISPLFTDRTTPVNFGAGGGIVNTSRGAFGGLFGTGTVLSSAGGINAGGFSVPSLGSLTQGITNGAQLQQQLQAQAASLVGGVVSSAANGIIGGLAAGLGPNGGATVNLIASAIQNPQAALATVTNMAATYAMQQVGTYVTNITQPLIDQASGFIKDQVSQLAAPITEAFGDLSRNVINEFSASYSTAALQEASFGGLF